MLTAVMVTGVAQGHGQASVTSGVVSVAESDPVVHLLNRIAYGPAPGDVERVRTLGVERYIDQQLHPERINDTALRARLEPLATLRMSSHELASKYERPLTEARKARKDGDTPTPEQRMVQMEANNVLVELSEQKII